MNQPIILLHEEALRTTHPVFNIAAPDTQSLYVWDDAYFRRANYSLKRLIFIYETLIELPLDIVRGDTATTIKQMKPSMVYVPQTNNPLILSIYCDIKNDIELEVIEDEAFSSIGKPLHAKRFYQYWKNIEDTVFLENGECRA